MNKDVERVLLTEEQIEERVKKLGQVLTQRFEGKSVLAVCVLKGSVIFFSDLIRSMDCDVRLAFMKAESYGAETVSSGDVRLKGIDELSIENQDVLIVEDIIDTGRTLKVIKNAFEERGAASVTLCTLLDKPSRRAIEIDFDYTGFCIEDEFVVGYGLDYNQRYRQLPYIGILKRSVYE